MKLQKALFDLPSRFYTLYGLILGVFAIGVQLRPGKRIPFKLVAARLLREPNRMYGIFTGGQFVGWTTLPKYTHKQIANALVDLTMRQGSKYLFSVLKADMGQEIPSDHNEDALAVLDKTFNWTLARQAQTEPVVSIVGPAPEDPEAAPYFFKTEEWVRQRGTRSKSKSSKKAALNLADARKNPEIRKQLNALEYQASRVADLTLELNAATETLEKMKKRWLMAKT